MLLLLCIQNGQAHLLVLADRDVGCVKIEIRIKQGTRFMHKQRGGLQKSSLVDIFKQPRLDRPEECVRIRHGDFRFCIGGISQSVLIVKILLLNKEDAVRSTPTASLLIDDMLFAEQLHYIGIDFLRLLFHV